VTRATGIAPWDMGRDIPRRRFYEASAELSVPLELAKLKQRCPLLE
jgi:hypothetical protein